MIEFAKEQQIATISSRELEQDQQDHLAKQHMKAPHEELSQSLTDACPTGTVVGCHYGSRGCVRPAFPQHNNTVTVLSCGRGWADSDPTRSESDP